MAKKQNITLTDLVTQNPALKIALNKFEGVKQQLDERAKQCLLIKVTDEASLNVCEQNLSKMNDLVTAVETLHEETKAPHWKNCKAIDNAKNYILDFEIDPIKYLKDEKIAWIKLVDDYNKFVEWCKNKYDTLILDNCDGFYTTLSKEPSADRWKGLTENVKAELVKYKQLTEIKKAELIALVDASPDEIEAIQQVVEEAKAKVEEMPTLSLSATKKVRRPWKFEVVNIADVPREFLCVDEAKVKEWMKSQEETLKDGGVVNGIRFFKDISVTV